MAETADKVIIFDTTLRDGEQSAGAGLTVDEKVRIARQLAKLGVDVIEAGFAASSPGDFEAIKNISQIKDAPIICSLARALQNDIEIAGAAIKLAERPRIHTFVSASDIHLTYQMKSDREAILGMVVDAVKLARQHADDVEFSPMDATRTDFDYLCKIVETAIAAGATTVNIPDTVGYAVPSEFGATIKKLMNAVPNIDKAVVSVHCHNDLGMAVSNSISAIENGARQVEGCINGLGERAGNAALEEVIMAIDARKQYLNLTTNVNTGEIGATSRLISNIYGFPVQYNKAIVGKNAFRHSSGIHQDGYLKNRSTFEIMSPNDVGWTGETIVLGKLSGRAGFKQRLTELGYDLRDKDLETIFAEFKRLADTKSEINDDDLHTLVDAQYRRLDTRRSYKLNKLILQTESDAGAKVTVVLKNMDGEDVSLTTENAGPVNAMFDAIAGLTGYHYKLVEYSVTAATEGIDAIGTATVRLSDGKTVYAGRGADVDVLTASAKAYVNAINRAITITDQNVADGEKRA